METMMGTYLMAADYVGAGITGLIKEGGSKRRSAIADLFDSMGGKLEAFYYAFAERNVYLIGELPDDATAMAMALKINSSGAATCRVTVLVTPEDMDIAVRKTGRYRAPGVDLEQAGLTTWDNEGGHAPANERVDTGKHV
jgi:uncharacterized protein with GYD domain